MAFRLKNNASRKIPYFLEFCETPRFWYPHVALVAWIDFNSRTVKVQPSERREKLPFLFSALSSLSLSIRFLSLPLLFASPLIFFFFPFSPSYPLNILFVYSPSHFLTPYFSLSFSLYLHFLFSFIFSFLFSLFDPISIKFTKWGSCLHTFLSSHLNMTLVSFSKFFLIFMIFLFP